MSVDFRSFDAACARLAAGDLATFRKDPDILQIVENVPVAMGDAYRVAIERAFPERVDDVLSLANDRVGAPDCAGLLAPATWRYAFRALELARLFGPLHVAEIGGGYGGLAAAAHQLIWPRAWVILDLPGPRALQERYLAALGITHVVTTWAHVLVSDFALSELSSEARASYAESVIKFAASGAVIWNEAGGVSVEDGAAWLAKVTGRAIVRGHEIPWLVATDLNLTGRLYWGIA